jgi:hypothetical protein
VRTWEVCNVCRCRITDSGWVPFCCEVCWDSAYAADRELGERLDRSGSPVDVHRE